jgi:monoamine oxidase
MGALLNAAYNEEYGAETTDQSLLNLIYLLGYNASPGNFSIYGASDERYHIVGGNTRLPLAIASALPNGSIHTDYRMNAIAVNSDGSITLSFDDGSTVRADHVILCMSFSVLRTLNHKKAGFDELKQTAITRLGSGINAKLNVQFDTRIWNSYASTGSLYSDLPFQSGWEVTRGQPGATGIFVEYPGANVSKSLGQSNPYTTTETNPHDPNFLCSYSYWKPGQYTGFSGYEKKRQGNIHFAGEHCSQDFQGFMEGGASEGVRAANEILGDLKKL